VAAEAAEEGEVVEEGVEAEPTATMQADEVANHQHSTSINHSKDEDVEAETATTIRVVEEPHHCLRNPILNRRKRMVKRAQLRTQWTNRTGFD